MLKIESDNGKKEQGGRLQKKMRENMVMKVKKN